METYSYEENQFMEYDPNDGCKQKTIMLVYYLVEQMVHCDLYFKGKIKDKKYFVDLSHDMLQDAVFPEKKKSQIVMGLARIPPRAFEDSDAIQRKRDLTVFKGPRDLRIIFIPVAVYDVNSKTKSLIKEILNKEFPHFSSDIYVYHHVSDDEEIKIVTPETKVSIDKPLLTSPPPPIEKAILITQKSDSEMEAFPEITSEMRENIKLLISINFISKHNHVISKDAVLLKERLCHAYGDWITDRRKIIHSREQECFVEGKMKKIQLPVWRISRIGEKELPFVGREYQSADYLNLW
jgi:hypothetical protein